MFIFIMCFRLKAASSASAPNSNACSDDDEQNDYGFNHRPSVRGIKPRANNEMIEEMQAQLSSSSVTKPPPVSESLNFYSLLQFY